MGPSSAATVKACCSGFLILLIFPVFMCGMRHAYASDTDAHALVFGVWLGVLSGTCWVLASTATDLPLLSDLPYLSSLMNAIAGLCALGAAGYVVPGKSLPIIRAIVGL